MAFMISKIRNIIIFIVAYVWFRVVNLINWYSKNIKHPNIHFLIGLSSVLIYHFLLAKPNFIEENGLYTLSGFFYAIPMVLFGRGAWRLGGYYLLVVQYILILSIY